MPRFTLSTAVSLVAPRATRSHLGRNSEANAPLCFSFGDGASALPLLRQSSRASTRGRQSPIASAREQTRAWEACDEPGSHKCLQQTFAKIDRDRKGHITHADLVLFAERRGLPASYVEPFMAALQQQQSLQEQQQQQQQSSRSSSSSSSDPDEAQDSGNGAEAAVRFEAFRQFVLEREAGLREAFQLFDTDGDGRISYADLDLSLSRVAICSPSSSCMLRTRTAVVAELMKRLNVPEGGQLDVSFADFRRFFMLLPEREQFVEYWLSGCSALACADMGSRFSILERTQAHRGSPWGHLLAGAVAGAASRSATAPLETLRLAAMAGALPPGSSLMSAGRQLVESGGIRALFKGNAINVLRSAPARAVDFFAFDLFKTWLGSDYTYSKTFAAAGLAGSFSWMLLYPLEVVRSRVTLDTQGRYAGMMHCIRTMATQEGPASFYRGLGPSVAAIAPEAALTYGLHDLLKRAYKQLHQREPGIAASLWCGVIAAWSGQLVSFPLETVSRRMQLAGAAAAPPAAAAAAAGAAAGAPAAAGAAAAGAAAVSSAAAGGGGSGSMAQVLRSILQEGGVPALYRGIGAATLRLVPSAMISFGGYEAMRRLITELEVAAEERRARAQHQQLHCVLSRAEQCNQLIQQVQQQALSTGSSAAAVALGQQCDACRPEALLQAAVQGSQLSEKAALQAPRNPGDNSSSSSCSSSSSVGCVSSSSSSSSSSVGCVSSSSSISAPKDSSRPASAGRA